MSSCGKSYGDYCDAGSPYGKQGFIKWIHEQYARESTPEYYQQALEEVKRLRGDIQTLTRLNEELHNDRNSLRVRLAAAAPAKLRPGFINRQHDRLQEESKGWPKWMKSPINR